MNNLKLPFRKKKKHFRTQKCEGNRNLKFIQLQQICYNIKFDDNFIKIQKNILYTL